MTSGMTIFSCWTVLLLTLCHFVPVAGRHIPASRDDSGETLAHSVSATVDQTLGSQVAETLNAEGAQRNRYQFQNANPSPLYKSWDLVDVKAVDGDTKYGHRFLVGSSPPTCQGKCGSCNPCKPIHVAIGSPHGAMTEQEYYPEVWRCKCGNRLFMP